MDISKAKKLVELEKGDRKVLVTLWDDDQISSCFEEETKKYCENCQGDEALCNDFIEHLKSQGYQATEIELGELGLEESLPRFLEEREITVKPKVAVAVQPGNVVEEDIPEPEGEHDAVGETPEDIPGSSGAPQEGE